MVKNVLYNKIYNALRRSPDILRMPLYFIPIKYRLGGTNFIKTYNFLKETEKWDKEKIDRYQKKQLQKLLEHAVNHVKFYSDISLTSNDPFKNLEKFPIVDKEIIQKNMKSFMANNIPRKNTYYITTGGTTGDQLNQPLRGSRSAGAVAGVDGTRRGRARL